MRRFFAVRTVVSPLFGKRSVSDGFLISSCTGEPSEDAEHNHCGHGNYRRSFWNENRRARERENGEQIEHPKQACHSCHGFSSACTDC